MRLGLRIRVVIAAGVAVLAALGLAMALVGHELPASARGGWGWRLVAVGAPVAAAVLAVLAFALQRWLTKPLAQLVLSMERARRGEIAAPALPVRGADELARLSEGFNALAAAAAQRERELAAARRQADEAARAKAQFMATMSHELRTPLNAVLGMAELLHNTQLDARQQRFVEQIRTSGRALVRVIDDVLELVRLETGRPDLAAQPFQLRDAVVDATEQFRGAADARSLELSVHIDPALPELVRGDSMHLRRILSILLGNAVKFTERGGVIVRVTPSDTRVRFSVSDTGIGIAAEFMPHIYEAFRQVDSSPTRRFGGAGLGLAIARRLCVAMGGLIDASSRPGKGSTFWFELPLPAVAGGSDPPID
jgi:signal transduction histidine kinase